MFKPPQSLAAQDQHMAFVGEAQQMASQFRRDARKKPTMGMGAQPPVDHRWRHGFVIPGGHMRPMGHVQGMGHIRPFGHIQPMGHLRGIGHRRMVGPPRPIGHAKPFGLMRARQ